MGIIYILLLALLTIFLIIHNIKTHLNEKAKIALMESKIAALEAKIVTKP